MKLWSEGRGIVYFFCMTEIKSFKDLRTWEESQRLVEEIYRVTRLFPVSEEKGLVDQMRRAAVSVPSNIAEGMGRGTAKELIQFLTIARGSIHELLSQIDTSGRLRFLSLKDSDQLSKDYLGLNAGINAHISQLTKYK